MEISELYPKKATPRLTKTAAADKHLLQTLKKEHFWRFFLLLLLSF